MTPHFFSMHTKILMFFLNIYNRNPQIYEFKIDSNFHHKHISTVEYAFTNLHCICVKAVDHENVSCLYLFHHQVHSQVCEIISNLTTVCSYKL